MAQVTITINSREYAVACEDGQEVRILQLARMLDEKAKMLTQASGQVNENMLLARQLNDKERELKIQLADELTELRKGNPAAATPNADNRQRILEIDRVTAEALDKIAAEINSVAKQIESL